MLVGSVVVEKWFSQSVDSPRIARAAGVASSRDERTRTHGKECRERIRLAVMCDDAGQQRLRYGGGATRAISIWPQELSRWVRGGTVCTQPLSLSRQASGRLDVCGKWVSGAVTSSTTGSRQISWFLVASITVCPDATRIDLNPSLLLGPIAQWVVLDGKHDDRDSSPFQSLHGRRAQHVALRETPGCTATALATENGDRADQARLQALYDLQPHRSFGRDRALLHRCRPRLTSGTGTTLPSFQLVS